MPASASAYASGVLAGGAAEVPIWKSLSAMNTSIGWVIFMFWSEPSTTTMGTSGE